IKPSGIPLTDVIAILDRGEDFLISTNEQNELMMLGIRVPILPEGILPQKPSHKLFPRGVEVDEKWEIACTSEEFQDFLTLLTIPILESNALILRWTSLSAHE